MTADLFKAVRPNGLDFYSATIDYAGALGTGNPVRHPDPDLGAADASGYLSAATVATDCTGMKWPCRLLRVQPVGSTVPPDLATLPHKVRCEALLVVEELPGSYALGPQGPEVAALIEWAARITPDDAKRLAAAGDAAWAAAGDAARAVAWAAAWAAARDAARAVAWAAARDAARDAGAAAGDAAWAAARDAKRLAAAADAAWAAARDAKRLAAAADAAWAAAWAAARDAARAAAWAALGLLVRDVLPPEHYQTLTRPWATVIGPCHPDDPR